MLKSAYFFLYWVLVKQRGLTRDLFWKIFGSPSFLLYHNHGDGTEYGVRVRMWIYPLCLVNNKYYWRVYDFGNVSQRQDYYIEHYEKYDKTRTSRFSEVCFSRGVGSYSFDNSSYSESSDEEEDMNTQTGIRIESDIESSSESSKSEESVHEDEGEYLSKEWRLY